MNLICVGQGPRSGVGGGREAILMSRVGGNPIAADFSPRRRVVVDVILLLRRNGRILLRERANTGYGDGAYEPPSGELIDRETIVDTAVRVAAAAGIVIGLENVSLAHVMHDVSGSGRIGFYLSVSGWTGEATSPDVRWFPAGSLPTNMLDRARVALRNYADGMRFSTYPSFVPASISGTQDIYPESDDASGSSEAYEPDYGNELYRAGESHEADGISEASGPGSRAGIGARRKHACGAGLLG
jgi:8-oxo-dGTP diphosphatase